MIRICKGGHRIANLSTVVKQLRSERDRAERELERLDNAIAALDHLGGRGNGRRSAATIRGRSARPRFSPAARARMAAAQRARWAKIKQNKPARARRKMSAAARNRNCGSLSEGKLGKLRERRRNGRGTRVIVASRDANDVFSGISSGCYWLSNGIPFDGGASGRDCKNT